MLEFEEYFPGARVLRLEQNYRSTGTILRAANEVIGHNRRRRGKKLWTEAEAGEAIELHWLDDEEGEAQAIRARIEEFTQEDHFRRQDCVVLYRTNAQSRALEDALRRGGLPYQIVGGTRFYERREVRDLLAYLKLVVNPDDAVSFERVVNVPRRGIGKTSLERLLNAAAERDLSPLRLCREQPGVLLEACGKAPSKRILAFIKMITELSKLVRTQTADWILRQVLETTRYEDWLQTDDPSTADDRRENVQELLNAAQTFVAESDEGLLADFLESVALLADVDRMEAGGDMVTLMTMHTAKGLEYPVVFVAGCEENLLPHANSVDEDDKLEEERRLFYVALTRAKLRVVLSAVSLRRRFGGAEPAMPSRFLAELPEDAVVERGERTPAYVEPAWSSSAPRRRRMYSDELPGLRRAVPHRRGFKPGDADRQDAPAAGGDYGADAFRRSRAKRKAGASPTPAGHGFEDHELSQVEQQFNSGQRVRHATLGEGTIVAVEGFGELTKLTIDFAEAGRKRVLARYARLEAMGGDDDLPF
jgi:DNA helicase-2/ATP-dependent DNA helicase PcrA